MSLLGVFLNRQYRRCSLLLAALFVAGSALQAGANPTGPQTRFGVVEVSGGALTQVHQFSERAIVDWQSFSIGTGERVQFLQPGPLSVILNRVVGGDPSKILGSLQANGNVFLINPNGIIFGPGSSINVGSLVTSTQPLSDEDFLSGSYHLTRATGGPAGVFTIQTASGPRSAFSLDGQGLVLFALSGNQPASLVKETRADLLSQSLGVPSNLRANTLARTADGSLRLIRAQTTGGANASQVLVQVFLEALPLDEDLGPEGRAFAQDNALLVEEFLDLVTEVTSLSEEEQDPTQVLNLWDDQEFMRHKNRGR